MRPTLLRCARTMKRVLLIFVVLLLASLGTGLALQDSTWNCSVRVSIADMRRNGGERSMSNANVTIVGVFIQNWYLAVPFRYETNLRGLGNYRFWYSDNIRGVALWIGGRKVYEGPQISNLHTGKGRLGFDLDAQGETMFEATDKCSLRSFVESFR